MQPRLVGTNHVNLTVSDLQRSTEWYSRVFGLTVLSNHKSIGPPYFNDVTYNGLFDLTTSSYVIGLIQHPDPLSEAFDARRVGLDHVGFSVRTRSDLEDWARHLDDLGVPHTGIVQAPYIDALHLRDPDDIALELAVINLDFWVPVITAGASPA